MSNEPRIISKHFLIFCLFMLFVMLPLQTYAQERVGIAINAQRNINYDMNKILSGIPGAWLTPEGSEPRYNITAAVSNTTDLSTCQYTGVVTISRTRIDAEVIITDMELGIGS